MFTGEKLDIQTVFYNTYNRVNSNISPVFHGDVRQREIGENIVKIIRLNRGIKCHTNENMNMTQNYPS